MHPWEVYELFVATFCAFFLGLEWHTLHALFLCERKSVSLEGMASTLWLKSILSDAALLWNNIQRLRAHDIRTQPKSGTARFFPSRDMPTEASLQEKPCRWGKATSKVLAQKTRVHGTRSSNPKRKLCTGMLKQRLSPFCCLWLKLTTTWIFLGWSRNKTYIVVVAWINTIHFVSDNCSFFAIPGCKVWTAHMVRCKMHPDTLELSTAQKRIKDQSCKNLSSPVYILINKLPISWSKSQQEGNIEVAQFLGVSKCFTCAQKSSCRPLCGKKLCQIRRSGDLSDISLPTLAELWLSPLWRAIIKKFYGRHSVLLKLLWICSSV